MDKDLSQQQKTLQQAARALGKLGLVHAYGHCSIRLDDDHFLVCAPLPMGCIGDELGTIININGPFPDGVLGEVRIHQAMYRARPNIGGICRILPPNVMTLSTQSLVPSPRHGIGAYFYPKPVLWKDPRLVRNEKDAKEMASRLGDGNVVVMRGNGAVIASDNIKTSVMLGYFLEDAARIELDIRRCGFAPETGLLNKAEIKDRQVWSGGVVSRFWKWATENT